MGIPSYFSYIIKNYSNIIRDIKTLLKNGDKLQHLYMDCNSIIYDAFRSIESYDNVFLLEELIVQKVIEKLDEYIKYIKPEKTVYIAFDGVAPFAKMEQQRNRRYKNGFSFTKEDDVDNKKLVWSTANITPGTQFMQKLSDRVSKYFLDSATKYNTEKIIVDTSNHCGEGEHKIFQYIRGQKNIIGENGVVYGLDSDLIMLSIFHCARFKNIYIFREAPEFIRSAIPLPDYDPNIATSVCYFMDIQKLSFAILSEMQCGNADKQRIFDYVFLCFFLGNDFLPHFPSLNIRTTGIQTLMETYRKVVGCHPNRFFIAKDSLVIQWKWVSLFINELAKYEHDLILAEYDLRSKWDRRSWTLESDEERDMAFQSAPVIYRQEEHYISPKEKFWESRYYNALFHIKDSDENRKEICMNYLEGLEWVFKYYTVDCPHWRWKYNYHYPPLFSDMRKFVPVVEKNLITTNDSNNRPFKPSVQLAYVLPKSGHNLLSPINKEYLDKNDPDLYPSDFGFQWTFCRYFWEAHALLPEIPMATLTKWEKVLV
jgi:hypothetical protein